MAFFDKTKKTAADMGEVTASVGAGIAKGVKIGLAFAPVFIALAILNRI